MLSLLAEDWDGVSQVMEDGFSNQAGDSIQFGNSESPGGSMGIVNNPANEQYAYDLRAVPEPSAFIPMILVLRGFSASLRRFWATIVSISRLAVSKAENISR